MLKNIIIILSNKQKNKNMKNKKLFNCYSRLLSMLTFLVILSFQNVYSQIPVSVEREMDSFNKAILDALNILKDKSESVAVKEIADLMPGLIQKAESLNAKLDELPEPTKSQEDAFFARQKEKQLFKDLIALLSNEAFMSKINGNPALLKVYNELMEISDMGLESDNEEADIPYGMKERCAFTVGSGISNSGSYSITASDDEAFACMDGNNQFSVEIHGLSGSNEIDIILFIEEPKPGKYKWENEMQVIIQGYTTDGDAVLELSSYYNEGEIQFDRIDKVGGLVTGSFSGKFSDDSNQTDKPVNVQGRFNVKRIADQ